MLIETQESERPPGKRLRGDNGNDFLDEIAPRPPRKRRGAWSRCEENNASIAYRMNEERQAAHARAL